MEFKFRSNETRGKVIATAKKTVEERIKKMVEAAQDLEQWDKESGEGVCVVCGEFISKCLDSHHPYSKADRPNYTVTICASCHRIFDKNGGLDELKERRQRYWNYNTKLREEMIK
jgi:hypothetical protein